MNKTLVGRKDTAVVICCDARFLPYALFTCRQIAFRCPKRKFDIVIVTQDALQLPDWATAWGVQSCQMGDLDPVVNHLGIKRTLAVINSSIATMLPITITSNLEHMYRRVLCFDSDIYFEGGDLDRLMQVDLGPHPLAAVREVMLCHNPSHHMPDMKAMGLPRFNYFNSGVMVIDTKAFEDQDVARRCWDIAKTHPDTLNFAGQSCLNGALMGSYAELAPSWNWCSSTTHPLLTLSYPVHIHHFAGSAKPNTTSKRRVEARFRSAYEDFFRLHARPAKDTPAGTLNRADILDRRFAIRAGTLAGSQGNLGGYSPVQRFLGRKALTGASLGITSLATHVIRTAA